VKLIVPSSAGGGTDFYARLLAQALGDALGQQFIVENQPGGSGNVGAATAARAAPDGYTFLVSPDPALTVNQSLFKSLPYNPERDFVPVARGVTVPLVVCVQASLGIRTLAELVERGKREPRLLTYGSSGSGAPNALAVRIIEEASGARFLHVPYRGMGMGCRRCLPGKSISCCRTWRSPGRISSPDASSRSPSRIAPHNCPTYRRSPMRASPASPCRATSASSRPPARRGRSWNA